MTPLQQEFFDMVVADMDFPFTEEELEEFKAALEIDIRGMNAAELRHNIKVWKETQ